MTNLAVKHLDPEEAAVQVAAAIRDEIPSAGVKTGVSGDPKQPSFRGAFAHELSGYFRSREPIAFSVRADWNAPRPMRLQCRYVQVGREAGPLSVLYMARLRVVVPGPAVIRRKGTWPLVKTAFDGDSAVEDSLAAAPGLGKGVSKFLQPNVVLGNAVYTIEPFVELVPDEDGAVLAAFNAPARASKGLGAYRLDLRSFLEIAEAVERAMASAPGVRPADNPGAPFVDEPG